MYFINISEVFHLLSQHELAHSLFTHHKDQHIYHSLHDTDVPKEGKIITVRLSYSTNQQTKHGIYKDRSNFPQFFVPKDATLTHLY